MIDPTAAASIGLAPSDKTNGGSTASQLPIDPAEMQRLSAQSKDIAAGLGQIMSLLMRARPYRHTMLYELETILMPAIVTRQFRIAESLMPDRKAVLPIAAVTWALVSPEVDKRLTEALDQPIKLKPEEWRSGNIAWIVEAIGEQQAISSLLQHLKQTELKDNTVRMRVRGQDGKPAIGRVELQPEAK